MATQHITKTFNVDLHHEKPVDPVGPTDPTQPTDGGNTTTQLAVPNTGFEQYMNNPTNWVLPSIILATCILGSILIFVFRKHKNSKIFTIAGSGCIAIAVGLLIPTICQLSAAVDQAVANTTTLEMTVGETDKTATATAQFLTDQEYPFGYTLSVYMTPNNALVNQSGTSQINNITSPGALEQLNQNSWGLKGSDATMYFPVSTSASIPMQIYATDSATPAGTNIDLTYGVKANKTLPEDVYSGTIHILVDHKVPEKYGFDYIFWSSGAEKDPVTNHYKMQDMTPDICRKVDAPTSASSGDEQRATLVDTRDNKTYTVGKMVDGSCWMTQNLALGSPAGSIELQPTDSDVSANYTLPASSSSWTAGDYYIAQNYYDNETGTSKPEVFYNYIAVAAGTVTGATTSGEAAGSVCPKGWKLPTGNTTGQFAQLYQAYGSDFNYLSKALQLNFAGYYDTDDHEVYDRGVNGNWWTSTLDSGTRAFATVIFKNGGITLDSSGDRTLGASVRCVAR